MIETRRKPKYEGSTRAAKILPIASPPRTLSARSYQCHVSDKSAPSHIPMRPPDCQHLFDGLQRKDPREAHLVGPLLELGRRVIPHKRLDGSIEEPCFLFSEPRSQGRCQIQQDLRSLERHVFRPSSEWHIAMISSATAPETR